MQTTLGVSNVSFGLNPAARITLNSVFLNECVKAGLDSAIVHAAKILPMSKIQEEQREVALDLVYDRRREGYDPLSRFLDLFEGVDIASVRASRAEELAALPLGERLARRIIDGERNGLEADLQAALDNGKSALDIVNDYLLEGMKVVGELFGKGEMQLPFVLSSAEVMKTAVAWLEPHMEKTDEEGKGTIVLATVKGDVHDIGKNLVDIILSNNGFTVVNIGIKQPVSAILDAADTHRADVIGMSGLLVKSTVVMKENLEEMNSRGISAKFPVILGGAALTRPYVEQDLAEVYEGEVRYARDAFEGLRLMDALINVKRGVPGAELPALRPRRVKPAGRPDLTQPEDMPARSDVAVDNPVPEPPFWGNRIVKGIHLQEYASLLDERATFMGQWGLKSSRASDGPSYEELVETEGRPRLRMWLERIQAEQMLEAAIVYGYFPVVSEGDDIVLLESPSIDAAERYRFTFPRQQHGRHLCLADFFRPRESGEVDVLGLQLVTMGPRIAEVTGDLFAKDAYRDYLELHGLSVQLTESLAEYWHKRMRAELGFAAEDPDKPEDYFDLRYRGARFSFGYGACPDLEDRAKLVDLLRAGADRGEAVRGVPAAPGAVHRRPGPAPPRGHVLQRQVSGLPAAVLFDMDGLLVDTEKVWFEVESELVDRAGRLLGAGRPAGARRRTARAHPRVHRGDRPGAGVAGRAARAAAGRHGEPAASRAGALDAGCPSAAGGDQRGRRTAGAGVVLAAGRGRRRARRDRPGAPAGHRVRGRRGAHQAAPRPVPAGRPHPRGRPRRMRGAGGLRHRRRLGAGRRLLHGGGAEPGHDPAGHRPPPGRLAGGAGPRSPGRPRGRSRLRFRPPGAGTPGRRARWYGGRRRRRR